MSSAAPVTQRARFGEGGTQPYDRTLREGGRLILREVAAHPPNHARTEAGHGTVMDVGRYIDAADAADLTVIDHCEGAVIDLGCGPGRMVHAAIRAGRFALGIDTSAAAVALATDSGLPVLRRDLNEDLPLEGRWGTVLLLDGNIGIGGDPGALLGRALSLICAGGLIIVETAADSLRDRRFLAEVTDRFGRSSAAFPWAEIGAEPLRRIAAEAGLVVERTWTQETPADAGRSERVPPDDARSKPRVRSFISFRA